MERMFALAMIGTVAACMSYTEIQQSEPRLEGDFRGNYRDFATCIALATNREFEGQSDLILDDSNQRGVITIKWSGITATGVLSETMVSQVAADRVHVEYRSAPVIVDRSNFLWTAVQSCED